MRRESFTIGDFVHIVRRGVRGIKIVRNNADRWRLLRVQYYLNDVRSKDNWFRDVENNLSGRFFSWPNSWNDREPLCSICAYALLDNHFHIIALERRERGISKFMQKSGVSISKHFNEKYRERGSLFQSPYLARKIDSDKYMRWVLPYILVKNTFEMYPGGYKKAIRDFDAAWKWAVQYPFSSLGEYAGERNLPIVNTEHLKDIIGHKSFKELCKDMIYGRKEDISLLKIRNLSMETD